MSKDEQDHSPIDQGLGFTDKVKRFSKMSKTVGGVAGHYFFQSLFGGEGKTDLHALALTQQLGELKGPLMKVAQLLATIPGAVPPEYTERLIELQANAPAMGKLFVKRRMRSELGENWQQKFKSFAFEASAAASLGQVHRAVTLEGDQVACKLQYPDMASTVESDLKNFKMMLGVYETFSKALSTEQVYKEIAERLNEELDYLNEAKNIQLYQKILEPFPFVRVPQVHKTLSTKRLITMEWLEGKSLLHQKELPHEERNELARRMFTLWYTPFYQYGIIHGDPHLGNYTFGPKGQINLLDFGCIRVFSPSFVKGVVKLYKALLSQNKQDMVEAYTIWGFDNLTEEIIAVLNRWSEYLYGPLLDDRIRPIDDQYDATRGREMASKVHEDLHKLGGVKPPREFVLLDRATVGMGAVFMHLKAELNWHQLYEGIIEGFDEEVLSERQRGVLTTF